MNEQVFLQVRVDKNLKEEAENILDKVGIEMPTAVRMFLKRIVLEGGIPFDTKIPEIAFQEKVVSVDSKGEEKEGMKVIHIPAKPAKYVPYE
ncbi:MAG: type II toxin-antitoxin system RelB/DinJ family antitoxin, partial [Clostridia bacterium]|nr:type II toxin-antitoxin system RelB/DinJ family antitoxin [Clostridia bacterium]